MTGVWSTLLHLPCSDPHRLSFKAGNPDGFGAYHDLYAVGSTVTRIGPAFDAELAAYRFPRLLMFDRQISGAVHHRDAARVRRDGLDHFNIQVLRAGRMAAGAPGEEQLMKPGDVVVFDTSRPQRTVVDGADYVAFSLPRDIVEGILPGARRLHGVVLSGGGASLLGDFALSLVRQGSTLTADLAARGSHRIVDLLASAAGHEGVLRSDDDVPSTLHRVRAEAYIDEHLCDPALSADRIAAALGLSRSALYRAFAADDGVARRIMMRRLRGLRAALRRPGKRRTVASLAFAFGFKSESHCGRAFKLAYGVAPGQFRAEARGGVAIQEGEARDGRLGTWFGEMR